VSAAYNFSLDRTRALLLAACFAAAAILLFFAGSISGVLYSGGRATAKGAPQIASIQKPMQASAASQPKAPAQPAAAPKSSTVVSGAAPAPAPVAGGATIPTRLSVPTAAPSSPTPGQSAPIAAAPSVESRNASSSATDTSGAKAAPQAASVPPPRPVETSYAIPLGVRVGSFAVKGNAEALVQSLKDLGYRPAMSRYSDSHGRVWYVVKLGPYTRWNAASKVAARVSIAENVRPVIGPMQ